MTSPIWRLFVLCGVVVRVPPVRSPAIRTGLVRLRSFTIGTHPRTVSHR